jgi:hypothetical protein
MAADARFCPGCGTSIGDAAAASGLSGEPILSDAGRLNRFGQVAKTIALLAFLLPWVTISCGAQEIASVSGVRLARGVISVRNPMTGAVESHSGSANWAVLLCALAIVLALLISFVRAGRAGALGGLIASAAAALLAVYAVLVDIPHQLLAGVHKQQAASGGAGGTGDLGASLSDSLTHLIKVEPAIGFWITLLALVAACVLDWLVQRRIGAHALPPGSP